MTLSPSSHYFSASQSEASTSSAATELRLASLRHQIASQCQELIPDDADWWLLGTSGCHLCDQAEMLIKKLQTVTPVSYQLVDIINLDDELMTKFANQIPVIITANSQLNYPFSILDLQRLSEDNKG